MKITVNKTCATVSDAEMLTSGMIGKTIDAEFSADWLGLTKIAVFTNGAVTRDVIEPTGTIIIPWEVLATPNKRVSVGFYGYRMEDGEKVLAIPTIFAELGAIRAGADPSGDPSATPTPEVAEQILGLIGDLDNLETPTRDNLVGAINDAYNSGGGSFDIHSLTAENALADTDELPFYDLSASASRKTTWSNIKAKLKAYFDTAYLGIGALSGYATQTWVNAQGFITSLAGYATEAWVEAKGYLTEHQSLSAYRTSAAQDVIDAGKAAASAVTTLEAAVDVIEGKIPSTATSSNQLADKAFVNSTVGTNTAYYISNNGQPFASLAQLQAYSGTVTNNDYAFVVGVDAAGNTTYTRYKYNSGTALWAAEYVLNNSSFTAVQWQAIESGITATLVASYNAHIANTDIHVTAAQKSAWDAKQDAIDASHKLPYAYLSGAPSIPTVPTNVSAFTNDSGYLTLATLPVYDGSVV